MSDRGILAIMLMVLAVVLIGFEIMYERRGPR